MIAVFSNPKDKDDNDQTINEFLLNCLLCADDGSDVFGWFYKWNDGDLAVRARDICKRKKLRLHFLTGSHEGVLPNMPVPDVARFFNDDGLNDGGAFPMNPADRRNHHKFMYFSAIHLEKLSGRIPAGTAASAVPPGLGVTSACYVSSSHPTAADTGKHNFATICPINAGPIVGDYHRMLRDAYRRTVPFLAALGSRSAMRALVPDDQFRSLAGTFCKLYLYPSTDQRNETTFDRILANIDASRSCTIRLVTPRISTAYNGFLARLCSIQDPGQVHIITRPFVPADASGVSDGIESQDMRNRLLTAGVRLYYEKKGSAIHSKYMLVNGYYKEGSGFTQQQLCWAGSPNLSAAFPRKNFESLLKIYGNTGLYGAFMEDFTRIRTRATVPVDASNVHG